MLVDDAYVLKMHVQVCMCTSNVAEDDAAAAPPAGEEDDDNDDVGVRVFEMKCVKL